MRQYKRTLRIMGFMTGLMLAALIATNAHPSGNYGFTETTTFEYVMSRLSDRTTAEDMLKDVPRPNVIYLNDMNMEVLVLEIYRENYDECLIYNSEKDCNDQNQSMALWVIGLYFPETNLIIVRESELEISECYFQSILVHEYLHFFQVLLYGPVQQDFNGMAMWLREGEAYKIQNEFLKEFCEGYDELL